MGLTTFANNLSHTLLSSTQSSSICYRTASPQSQSPTETDAFKNTVSQTKNTHQGPEHTASPHAGLFILLPPQLCQGQNLFSDCAACFCVECVYMCINC